MRPHEEARASVEAWLTYAAADVEGAQMLLGSSHLSHMVCFHAQQAVEKALKGYLAWLSDDDIPRTHNLLRLAALIIERRGLAAPATQVELLNAYSVQPRYPETDAPAHHESERAPRLAIDVIDFVTSAIRAGITDEEEDA